MRELAAWESFYGIVGSSSGSLIGLQFVVMTLFAQTARPNSSQAGAAFATPTIYHFAAALLLSLLLRAPWPTLTWAAAACGLVGFAGAAYALVVGRRMILQNSYGPCLEDWVFHLALPLLAYVALAISPLALAAHELAALFVVAAAVLALLFVGIHNAWDNVVYHVYVNLPNARRRGDQDDA